MAPLASLTNPTGAPGELAHILVHDYNEVGHGRPLDMSSASSSATYVEGSYQGRLYRFWARSTAHANRYRRT